MAGAKVPLTFRIFKGDQLVREEQLSLSVIKLGKVPSAHLKLDDETVSAGCTRSSRSTAPVT